MNYSESTEFLLALPDMERKNHGAGARTMSLEAMQALLEKLGNPELGRKTAHVTGSKGKGSTSAFLAAMLNAVEPTALYTSPHLHSFRERMCFNLIPVAELGFAEGVSLIRQAVTDVHEGELGPISTFGALTALFFELSRQQQMRWQVVEVGMGGTYDATNVFPRKELAIITAVSLEHTKVLGSSTVEIAMNKAGIIRPFSTVILAQQHDAAVNDLVRRLCLEQGANYIDVAEQYEISAESYDMERQNFSLSAKGSVRQFEIGMLGRHQIQNAVTAIAAVDVLNADEEYISVDTMKESLACISVPGRLEIVHKAPWVVVDGAHNGESIEALIQGLKRHFSVSSAAIVLGVNADKNIKDILAVLKPFCSKLIATRSSSEKAMEAEIIGDAARLMGFDTLVEEKNENALEKAMQLAGSDGLVCVTGSLYLVAEVRSYFFGPEASGALLRDSVSA